MHLEQSLVFTLLAMSIFTLFTGLCLATWCRGMGSVRRLAPGLKRCTVWLQEQAPHPHLTLTPPRLLELSSHDEVLSAKASVMEMFGP